MESRDAQAKEFKTVFGHFRRPLLLVAALIILVIGYFAVLADPIRIYQENYSVLQKLNSDIGVAKNDLETSKIYSAKIYPVSALEAKLLDMALPPRPNDSSLIIQLSSAAKKAGFSVSNIDIETVNGAAGSKINSEKIGKVSVRLKLKGGGYEELKQFLKLMESSLMMTDVYSVNFTAKSPVYDLALVAYYYNDAAAN